MVAGRQVFLLILRSSLIGLLWLNAARAQNSVSEELYQLTPQDMVRVTVFGEDNVTAERRVDAKGSINLPLLGAVLIAEKTLLEAENTIRQRYIDSEIFIDPQISLSVVEYSPKEVSVLGQVASPGRHALPAERHRIGIVELITAAGGFTRIGKADGVRVTRNQNDTEEVFTVNVERLINGRSREGEFMVEAGDIVFVPERVF